MLSFKARILYVRDTWFFVPDTGILTYTDLFILNGDYITGLQFLRVQLPDEVILTHITTCVGYQH
jgi:hypothetical protein